MTKEQVRDLMKNLNQPEFVDPVLNSPSFNALLFHTSNVAYVDNTYLVYFFDADDKLKGITVAKFN